MRAQGPLRSPGAALAAVLSLSLNLACGSADDGRSAEGEFERASDDLEQLRLDLQEARKRLDRARLEVSGLRGRLRQAEEKLAEAGGEITGTNRDTLLYRRIMRRLREEQLLVGSELGVFVSDQVATLSGTAHNASQVGRALEVTAATPGVRSVESRIQITATEGTPSARSDPGERSESVRE